MQALSNFLADDEAHTNAILVHLRSAFQFTEQIEKFCHLILSDSLACVNHVHL